MQNVTCEGYAEENGQQGKLALKKSEIHRLRFLKQRKHPSLLKSYQTEHICVNLRMLHYWPNRSAQ